MNYKAIVVFVLSLSISFPVGSSYAETCRFRFFPTMEEMDVSLVTVPNSVCIFPDGRTSLQDAVSGDVEIVYYWLNWLSNNGIWVGYSYGGEGLFVPGNVHFCGETEPGFLSADISQLPTFFHEQPIYGGGHSEIDGSGNPAEGCVLLWAPSECGSIPLEIYFNSPDINGDLVVDLLDQSLFAQDFFGLYNYRSDFNFDGKIDLFDLGVLSQAIGGQCP